MAPPLIVVHGLEDARRALACARALGMRVRLCSAPGAQASAGPSYLMAMLEAARHEFPDALAGAVVDCGDDAGHALAALRLGAADVLFAGGGKAKTRLEAIARRRGARLHSRHGRSFTFAPGAAEAADALARWLAAGV